MNAKRRMNPVKRPVNSPIPWQSQPKQGMNWGIFYENGGIFCRKPVWRKDLQMYGSTGNTSLLPARTYGAKRRALRRARYVSTCQARTSVGARDFIAQKYGQTKYN